MKSEYSDQKTQRGNCFKYSHLCFSFVPDPEMSEICSKLWDLDVNRCEPGVDYDIDLQGNQY